jgi:hypothetical protein
MRFLRSLVCVLGDLLSSHVICSCTIFGNELTVNTDAGDSHVTRVLGLFVYTSNSGKLFMSKSLSQVFCSTSTSTSLNYIESKTHHTSIECSVIQYGAH